VSLNFLSGFLLTAVVIAILAYMAKEMFGGRVADKSKSQPRAAGVLSRLGANESKPVNEHLIGAAAKVIAQTGDDARPIRVRVGAEHWPARFASGEAGLLPEGAAVTVTAVDGAVLVVAAADDVADTPSE